MGGTASANFEATRDNWISLMKKGELAQANDLYWKEIFPTVEERFVKSVRELVKSGKVVNYDCIIIPMGLHALYTILVINAFKPKKVYLLTTEEVDTLFLDLIMKKTGLQPHQLESDRVDYDELDLAEVYDKIKKRLKLFSEYEHVAVDITRGKRVMATGAGLVGAFFGFDLIYIDEKWLDEIKRGEPGTEKIVRVKNPYQVYGDLEQKYAEKMFEKREYDSAAESFNALRSKVMDPRETEVKALICEAYAQWESFNYNAALERLESGEKKIRQFDLGHQDLRKKIRANSIALQRLSKLQKSGDNFQSLKPAEGAISLAVDLLCNAERRAEQGNYGDAISRAYRSGEVIAQHGLAALGMDANKAVLSLETEYKFLAESAKVYDEERKLPRLFSLLDAFILLHGMGDKLAEGISTQELKKLRETIEERDDSITGHGTKPASPQLYAKLRDFAKSAIRKACSQAGLKFNELLSEHAHPKKLEF